MPDALLKVRNLKKYFPIRGGLLSREVARVHAVDDVSFDIMPGETLGLVGESGCGKSTTGRTILRLIEPTSGEVSFQGKNVTTLDKRSLRALRKEMQIIFQDPYASLNPRMTVGSIIGEALVIHKLAKSRRQREERVVQLLETVGLSADHLRRCDELRIEQQEQPCQGHQVHNQRQDAVKGISQRDHAECSGDGADRSREEGDLNHQVAAPAAVLSEARVPQRVGLFGKAPRVHDLSLAEPPDEAHGHVEVHATRPAAGL